MTGPLETCWRRTRLRGARPHGTTTGQLGRSTLAGPSSSREGQPHGHESGGGNRVPHGRAETAAQVADLEQVPRQRNEYRGVVLEEMDLDALLARHPTVALVDELAHTNAPGSRNAKRYQDVEELLRAGINVISTMNIQHLESLYDLIEQATGVKVKERVPDYVLAMADQIVNVDLSAEDLRERLQAGKVYPKERVEAALGNFFTLP